MSSKHLEAAERFSAGIGPVVLTCEHASNRLPPAWSWHKEDKHLVDTHWASDLGIADLTRAVAHAMGVSAVLSRFSRLLIDPNRHLGSATLFRTEADGQTVRLNSDLHEDDRAIRIDRYYQPFHDTIAQTVEGSPGPLLISMHSFTANYEGGSTRPMEIGVLFDHDDDLAHAVAPVFTRFGLKTALNEPYTGKNGLMYSVQSHATRSGRAALELEVRQDLATDPKQRDRLVAAIVAMAEDALGRL